MAYFSNGSEADVFDSQCNYCVLRESGCPIEFVQIEYNYEACDNELASKILEELVSTKNGCQLYIKNEARLESEYKYQPRLFG